MGADEERMVSVEARFVFSGTDDVIETVAARVAEMVKDNGMNRDIDPYLTVEEAARYIGAPRSRIYDLTGKGAIESRKDGRRLLTKRSWLDRYLDDRGST